MSFGFRKWISFIICAICYAFCHLHRYSPSVLAPDMAPDLNVTISKLGIFSSMYFWSYAAMQPIIGCLADVVDPGMILFVSGMISSLGSIIVGISSTFVMASIGRFMVGIGVSCTFVSVCRFMANWFNPQTYTLINSILLSIGGIGGISSQKPLLLMSHSMGWRWSMITIGIFGLVFAILAGIIVRDSPITLGYPKVDGTEPPIKRDSVALLFQDAWDHLIEVIMIPEFWVHAMSIFFSTSCFQNVSGMWAVPYMTDTYGFSRDKAATISISLLIVMIFGSPILGYISFKTGMKKGLHIICLSFGFSVTLVFVIFVNKVPELALYPLFFFFGATTTSTQSFTMPMFKDMVRPSCSAAATGCGNMFVFLGAAIAQSTTSLILNSSGKSPYSPQSYRIALWGVCLISLSCAIILASYLKMPQLNQENIEHDPSVDEEIDEL